ncbi:c-14 sterol reductase [Pyrenophora seminiperda CCB06]|uniref:C-14 sterol reductase n=1 Tax=Pyrenophora seminiperda CCB06 TaxID=1302712 RepID=A0A3M7MJQ7_9PLEO|nr:c-14 sterol reductase [Pyrenophora seminiperda CCB06]
MVLSPRKRAAPTTTFDTTWKATDAAFLDPNALPLAKIPRGWERKQEVKRIGQGREKKIWRRFNLRSHAQNTTQDDTADDGDDDEQDARSRAVKRRQHMSPKAMEKTSSKLNGKKRAFKATRWDRRKSVLPRKKAARIDDPTFSAENEANGDDEGDSRDVTELEGETFTDTNATMEEQNDGIPHPPPLNEDSKVTVDFTMDASTEEHLPDYESLERHPPIEQEVESRPAEDATLATLFRSPLKYISTASVVSPENVDYPHLPHSHDSTADLHEGTPGKCENTVNEASTQDIVSESAGTEHATIQAAATIHVEKSEAEKTQSPIKTDETEPLAQVEYPILPSDDIQPSTTPDESMDEDEGGDENAELSEVEVDMEAEFTIGDDSCSEEESLSVPEVEDPEEEFTEAILQLDIMRDYQAAQQKHDPPAAVNASKQEDESEEEQFTDMTDAPDTAATQDITEGLTLSFAPTQPQSSHPTQPQSLDSTPRKLHSPPPLLRFESELDDATMTFTFDDDTAVLKDFLNRAAASKAEKAAITTHRRESLQNRRDSDVVRHALASPRKVLEEKDPNSPSKHDNELTLDLSQNLTLSMPIEPLPTPTPGPGEAEEDTGEKSARSSRRSTRTKKSRLPAPTSTGPAPKPKIAIRRADGNEVVVLKKDDTKVLADLTRNNTRKNKQGAFGVTLRLMKLMMEASSLPPIDDATKELVVGKNVRWDEQLAYYQENPETVANALAEAESLATPDELGMGDTVSESKKKKAKLSKDSTPKVRRVRGLGSANGTPGKGLRSPASLLPEAVQEEKESVAAPSKQLPKPKAGKAKKMPVASNSIDSGLSSSSADTKLPSLDVTPVGIAPTTQRKSRLAAPKKVVLPKVASSAPGEGKENAQRSGLSDATPKKGIPVVPKTLLPPTAATTTAGMESGLPRRKGRKY